MKWNYYKPKFGYEEKFNDFYSAWAGHKFFAYDLIRNFNPKKIVELGTHKGTSFFSFCQAVKDSGFDSELNAVDTWKGDEHAGFYGEEVFDEVKDIKEGFYNDLDLNLIRKLFDDALPDFEDESIDLLHIDGLHTYEAVKHDFESWLPKVKKDGVILFHDICEKNNGFGVYKLWEELKKKYSTLEFHHSHGLGVVFLSLEKFADMPVLEEIWRNYYEVFNNNVVLINEKKNVEIVLSSEKYIVKQKEGEVNTLNEVLMSKEVEIVGLNEVVKVKEEEVNILNEVVVQKDFEIAELNEVVKVKEGEVAELNEVVMVKEEEVVSLNEVIKAKEDEVNVLSEVVAQKDFEVAGLNEVVMVKEEEVASLNEVVEQKDAEIDGLNDLVKVKEDDILSLEKVSEDIEKSLSYKIGRAITWPLRIIFPVNTKRNLILRLIIKSLSHPLYFKKVLKVHNIKKLFRAIRNESSDVILKNAANYFIERTNGVAKNITVAANDKITVAVFVPFNFLSYNFGGGIRVMDEYKSLAEHFNVIIVAIEGYGGEFRMINLAENLNAYVVPMTKAYHDLMLKEEKLANGHLHDILLTHNFNLIPELTDLYGKMKKYVDVFVSVHPYFFKMFLSDKGEAVYLYEAQDVNYDLKKIYFENYKENETALKYTEIVKEVEEIACKQSDFITVVAQKDIFRLRDFYGVSKKKMVLVANGVDVGPCRYVSPLIRFENIRNNRAMAVFMGSAHAPNIEAVDFILNVLAPADSNIDYVIIGNLSESYHGKKMPSNIKFLGMVSTEEKSKILETASIALNPMFSGGGTNLKVLEYCAYGLPLISTKFGMRGYDDLCKHVYTAEKNNFLAVVQKVLAMSPNVVEKKSKSSRDLVVEKYNWQILTQEFINKIKSINRK